MERYFHPPGITNLTAGGNGTRPWGMMGKRIPIPFLKNLLWAG